MIGGFGLYIDENIGAAASLLAEEIELDTKVDIIISEWMGLYLLHESMLDSVIARGTCVA